MALESFPAVSAASPSPTASPAILVDHLVKRYSGRAVVDDLSFAVQSGEVFALLGPNGAGKTTTLEIVEGYRTPDSGTVRVLGLDPQRQGDALHRRIGLMLQQGGFYPAITPAEALDLFASFYERPADPAALLHLVGLEEAARTRYRRLSGGQKQRLSLAVALVGQPELVFLDEPTAGMDPQARRATWEIIRDLKARGVTIVLTTHLLDEAERLADRIAIVDAGRLIAMGTLAELIGGNNLGDVVLTLAVPIDLTELEKLPRVLNAHLSRSDQVVLQTASPSALLVELTTWLRDHGIVPREIRCGQGSLEDVFLALTGKDLRD